MRVVVDSQATLPLESQLVRNAGQVPVIVAAAASAAAENRQRLEAAGCDVLSLPGLTHVERLGELLRELGRRRMTNVLVEGGGKLLGNLADLGQIDELHVFIAPRVIGGNNSPSPVGGLGVARLADALSLDEVQWRQSGDDLYFSGRLAKSNSTLTSS